MAIVIRAIPKVLISVRRSQDGKKTHQKSYHERAGEMLMPVNQINQIYQLRRVCWNHFSFFSIIFSWFWFNLLPSATITINISFLWAFEWCMSRGHLRLYTEILPLSVLDELRRSYATPSAGMESPIIIFTYISHSQEKESCNFKVKTHFSFNLSFS